MCYKTIHWFQLSFSGRVCSKRESAEQTVSDISNKEWSLEPFSSGGQLTSQFMAGENGHS